MAFDTVVVELGLVGLALVPDIAAAGAEQALGVVDIVVDVLGVLVDTVVDELELVDIVADVQVVLVVHIAVDELVVDPDIEAVDVVAELGLYTVVDDELVAVPDTVVIGFDSAVDWDQCAVVETRTNLPNH